MKIERTTDIATCRALRRRVFVEEQGVSEADEIDDRDGEAIHLLAWDGARAVGTARLLRQGEVGKIGRVCVLGDCRGTGVGAALMRAAIAEFRAMPGVRRVHLGSQTHAVGFYETLGFHSVGEDYVEAGIMHRDMELEF